MNGWRFGFEADEGTDGGVLNGFEADEGTDGGSAGDGVERTVAVVFALVVGVLVAGIGCCCATALCGVTTLSVLTAESTQEGVVATVVDAAARKLFLLVRFFHGTTKRRVLRAGRNIWGWYRCWQRFERWMERAAAASCKSVATSLRLKRRWWQITVLFVLLTTWVVEGWTDATRSVVYQPYTAHLGLDWPDPVVYPTLLDVLTNGACGAEVPAAGPSLGWRFGFEADRRFG